MNWLLGLLFLICIFSFYYLLGDFVCDFLSLHKINSTLKFIFGYICLSFLGFVVGFPAQLFKISWNIYFFIFSLLLLLILLLLILRTLKKIKEQKIKLKFKDRIATHLKENWFIYFLAVVFIAFYTTSYLNYSYVCYDDAYYITKIASFVGRAHLFGENYFTGFVHVQAKITYRILNSYELTYAYFASLFHISIPFFAKIVMSLNNLLISFFVFKIIADKFVSKKYAQFCLIFIPIFMIPEAIITRGTFLNINLYDFWQVANASFYGGNIVRNISLPVYMYEFYLLYKDFNKRVILLLVVTSIGFMSLSTIFVIWFIMALITYLLLVAYRYYERKFNFGKNMNIIFCVFVSLLIICGDFLVFKGASRFIKVLDYFVNRVASNNIVSAGNLLFISGFLIVLVFIFQKKEKIFNEETKFYALSLIVPYILIFSGHFNTILFFISGMNDFVVKRYISSIITITFILFGVLVYSLLKRFNRNNYIVIFSIIMCLGVPSFVYLNQTSFYRVAAFRPSGIERPGYKWNLAFQNDEMMPEVTTEVGNYFNALSRNSNVLLAPTVFEWNGASVNSSAFLMTSNRVQLVPVTEYMQDQVIDKKRGMSPYQFIKLVNFMNNRESYNNVLSLLKKYKVRYIFVTNKYVANTLIEKGNKLVLSNQDSAKEFYLFELSL